MKKFSYTLILFLSLIFLPLSETNARIGYLWQDDSWLVFYETAEGTSYTFGQIVYQTPSFTANGKEYRPLSVSHTVMRGYFGNERPFARYYYRSEGKNIFRYVPSDGTEILMYEFGHEVGDTVTDGDGNRLEVTEVFEAKQLTDFTNFNNGEKAYKLKGIDDSSLEDIWIDHIGSISTGIFRRSDFEGAQNFHLSYFGNSGNCFAMTFPVDYEDMKSAPVLKDAGFDSQSSYDEWCNKSPYVQYEFVGDTLHVKGIGSSMTPDYYDVIYAMISADTIKVTYLPLDYGLSVYDNLGKCLFEAWLPGFKRGTYTITSKYMNIDVKDIVLTCPSTPMTIPSDVNNDGTTDISDVVAVISVIAGTDINERADVNGDGNTDISDIVAVINSIAESIPDNPDDDADPAVEAGLCPDPNHPHAIDIGIGIRFACCNVGATAPWEYGGHYGWGETEERKSYGWGTYTLLDGLYSCIDIGEDISGTEYDVAFVKWGGGWHMPNPEQMQQLIDNCTFIWTRLKGVEGRIYAGPNGRSFFLPAAGINWYSLEDVSSRGYYWLCKKIPDDMPNTDSNKLLEARSFNIDRTSWTYNLFNYRECGLSVRPVIE